MVHSQMTALEEPDTEDETDVIPIDVTNDKEVVQTEALRRVTETLKAYDGLVNNQQS